MIFALLFSILAITVLYCYRKFNEIVDSVKHIPGPEVLPFIGNALIFFGRPSSEIALIGMELLKKYGLFNRILLGPKVLIHVGDPEDVEALLVDQKILDKSDEYDITSAWIGTGLLTASKEKWLSRRKVTTPGFHFRCLQEFVKVFDRNSEILVQKMKNFGGESIDIFPLAQLCALDNICETAMGTKINAQLNSDSSYVKAVEEITALFTLRFFQLPLRFDFVFKLTPYYTRLQELLKILHGFTDSVIIARREELEKQLNNGNSETKTNHALLDVLLQSTIDGKPLTNMDIREEVDTFSFAGHDTTTTGISFCLYNLAKYPEVQQKAYEEIQNVIGDDSKKEETMNNLNELNYLELVIKESLRTFPPVPFIGRRILDEVTINGKVLPKGSTVVVSLVSMGRSEKVWDNPSSFIPERFEAQNMANKPSCTFVVFGAGPRNCIGQKFAMLEMKSVVSKVLRMFEISIEKDFEPILKPEIVLKSANGIKLRLKNRF